MKRSVSIYLILPPGSKPVEINGLPETVKVRVSTGMDDSISCSWLIPENDWPALKRIRSELRNSIPGQDEEINEWCNAMLEPSDLEAASLVAMAIPGVINRSFVDEEPVVMASCGDCGGRTFALQEDASLRVKKGPGLPVMSLGRHGLLAVSPEVRQALERSGLAGGVRFLPVEVAGGEGCWMVVPDQRAPLAAAPYGWAGNHCPGCGRGVARYSFFPVFQRGSSQTYWFRNSDSELQTPIVDRKVFSLLSSAAADTLKRKKLMGMVYGWAETDSAAAFLPEEYQE
ncbi:MAG TPA: hypothetical protein PLM22_08240 [Candidatus Sabulitectum sp.]|nr:hypothetical protein [Candidatus Sabulitectum sp.]HPJ28908.1 hypothetical protein [Candidatus Sabulitectum sp.]